MSNVKLVKTDRITLFYVCENVEDHEDNLEVFERQPLTDIVATGALVCPECDADMDLQGYAGVERRQRTA